jgi:hypothetical protein
MVTRSTAKGREGRSGMGSCCSAKGVGPMLRGLFKHPQYIIQADNRTRETTMKILLFILI